MAKDNRWSISELLARYDLEPELLDVFVEGQFDCDVLSRVQLGPAKRAFYAIDVVDVPSDVLGKYDLSSGNKQRTVALARELSSGLAEMAKVVCLVDRDLDHWFGELEKTPHLRWSRFSCIESHFLTQEIITEALVVAAKAAIKSVEVFYLSLTDTLQRLYALRLADRDLGFACTWVALRKYLVRAADEIQFRDDKYLIALLHRNAKSSRTEEFRSCYQKWRARLDCDIRLAMRGHDYTRLLEWAVDEFDGLKEFASAAAIERVLVLLAQSVPTISVDLE